jgi:hypothetical protein
MALWQGILIVIGCVVVGSLVGFLLVQLFRRKNPGEYSVSNKEGDFTKNKDTKNSFATTLVNGTTKSNGHEDALEVLIKNHHNSIITENPKQPNATDFPRAVEIDNRKNAPVIRKEEKPTQPAISWTELAKPSNQLAREASQTLYEPPVVKEPAPGNKNSALIEGEPKKNAAPSVFPKLENANQKLAPVEKKQKKVPISTAHKKPDTGNGKNSLVVKEQNKSTQPLVTADITKIAEIPSVEKHKEPPKLSPPETATIQPKITQAVEKQVVSADSDIVTELQTNLTVASTPWADKLISFQTKCWNNNHGEFNPLLTTHHQELIQLYVDIGLANNIVWLATEIGHRSKELDDSYIKLCSGIADNIQKILLR